MFDPARAKGLTMAAGFEFGEESFLVTIGGGEVKVERADAAGGDCIFAGSAPAVAAAVYGGVPIEALEAEAALQVRGDRAEAKRFTTLFPLPAKVDG
jgi:hypothetical protein